MDIPVDIPADGRERRRTPFGDVYEAHFDAVPGFVTRRTADRDVAADLTADVFVAALEAFGSYDPRRGAHRVWL